MAGPLQDKIVVVTGGGTGIGLGIVGCCVQQGAAVVLAQRREDIVEREAAALRGAGYRAIGVCCDVSRRSDVRTLIESTVREFGRLDVLVNNAALTGKAAQLRSFIDESDEHWHQMIDTNLTGAFMCTQEAARRMITQGDGGSILNISSVAQYAAQEHAVPYCVSP